MCRCHVMGRLLPSATQSRDGTTEGVPLGMCCCVLCCINTLPRCVGVCDDYWRSVYPMCWYRDVGPQSFVVVVHVVTVVRTTEGIPLGSVAVLLRPHTRTTVGGITVALRSILLWSSLGGTVHCRSASSPHAKDWRVYVIS